MNDRLGIAWNASLQAANLLFKAEYDARRKLLDEAYPHAADINDPVVKGLVLLERASIAGLRDEDYLRAKQLAKSGFPPGTIPDFRMTWMPFTMAITACGLGDLQLLRPYLGFVLDIPPFNRDEFFLPLFTPCRLLQLADQGDYQRVVELLRGFMESIVSFRGRPFPMDWAHQWSLLQRLRARSESELDAAAFQAAWERGGQISSSDLVQEVRFFIDICRGYWLIHSKFNLQSGYSS